MLVCNGADIIPTICSFAQIQKPDYLKGVDISRKIENPALSLRDTLVIETDFADNQELLGIGGRAVMTKEFKYIVYDKGLIREQLFDLAKDPGEITNLVVQAAYKKRLIALRNYLKKWCRENGDKFSVTF